MSKVKGVRSVRRLFKRLPDGMRDELAQVMRSAGPELAGAMTAAAPRGATGKLQAGIAWRFYASSLRLRVGYIGKPVNRRLFYAHILDLGRRAQRAKATRRSKSGKVSSYVVNVRAIKAKHFVTGKFPVLRTALNRRLKTVWQRVLQRVADGGSD